MNPSELAEQIVEKYSLPKKTKEQLADDIRIAIEESILEFGEKMLKKLSPVSSKG